MERSERTPHEGSPESAPAPEPLAPDIPRAEDTPLRPSLLPSAESMAPLPNGTFPVPPDEPGPPGTRLHAPEHPSPKELVDGTIRGSLAEARARNGLSHSYFSGMGHTLQRSFEQAQAEAEREATPGAKARQKADDVSSVLSRSATMEDPLDTPRRPDPLASLPSRPAPVEDVFKQQAYSLPQLWTRTAGVVVVRLTQAADGHVLSAELVGSSGDTGLDGAAVSSARALGEEAGPLPPEVLQGRDSVVSEWRFELLRTIAGPAALGAGIVGTFDVTSGVHEALPSFAAVSKVRVTLLGYQ